MIVRCNNCASAFAVDDEKVANKKFAFTCPKCSSENIIDNRIIESQEQEKTLPQKEPVFNDDFSIDTGASEHDLEKAASPDFHDEEIFFDDTPAGKEDEFESFDDELASEFPADDIPGQTVKKEKKINLEIEESEDFPEFEDEDILSEPADKKKSKEADIFDEIPAFESDEDFITFDEEKPLKKETDEFGIELKEDSEKSEKEDVIFDDFEDFAGASEKPEVKDEFMHEESEFDFDELETGKTEAVPKADRDKKLTSQDDIDALFAEEGINFDEKPISKENELAFEDEITVDLDTLDIDLEEAHAEAELFEEPAKAEKPKIRAVPADDDITLDMDTLDIDLEEAHAEAELFEEPAKAEKPKAGTVPDDDDITLDLDNLDIDLEEAHAEAELFEEPVKPGKPKIRAIPSDDDITLDMDTLDIDLDETPVSVKDVKKSSIKDEILPGEDFDEEDIKLNLDDLDIDLDEIEERELIFEDDLAEKPAVPVKKGKPIIEESDEDESITIDLDTLEIEIAEENRSMREELSEEDEKLTLDDAGLTFDELTKGVKKPEAAEQDEEELKLTINEIDPDLTLDRIAGSGRLETRKISDTLEELPEIDLDEYDAIVREEKSAHADKYFDEFEDDFVVFPETEEERSVTSRPDYDMFDYEDSEKEKSPERGSTFFSIDFSLKYSRLGALLRLLGLYMLSMIPHFVVVMIYTALSSILGFINQIVVLSTGRCVEDFALIIENTLRYYFYINANITGIVEDRPVYAGRESIDHPLQLNITYPLKYSKNLAILRLSILGIMIITLPHLIIMSLIALTIPFVYLTGIIAVLITRRWPNLLFIYLTKFYRYFARISSFMTGLTDEYPPFSFD